VTAVRLPDDAWGQDATEALLSRWLVAEGTPVRAGQPLAEAIIVKTTLTVHAPADGTLSRILVPEQATFGRGQDVALMAERAS
jgi:pyruvate/2-oxoglutarate dehydrogenase complex dihydrolipoamide acyltransferase (E2) component